METVGFGARLVSSSESAVSERPSSSPPASAKRLAAQLLDPEDLAFLDALQAAGLMSELDDDELLRIASEAESSDQETRWVQLIETYYAADASRRGGDRYFTQRVGQPATAAGLVGRLAELLPELEGMALERIGGEEGPLVVRAGEHFCAVLDEHEEEMDTDQIDLSDLEDASRDVPHVTVRGLVRSANVLLDRHGVRERMISLRGDLEVEMYVFLGITEAMPLANAGYLEDEDPEDVMELAAW